MFDDIPISVWLLIAIAVAAYAPALYLFRHLAHAPSRRDITKPSEDLSWRTSSRFARNLSILTALIALAVFIFTPAARQFAQSPSFWPILITAAAAFALFTVAKGLATGQIEPLIRGFDKTYQRDTQPKRFWASIGWNASFGCLFLWIAFGASQQSVEDRCHSTRFDHAREAISACSQLITKGESTRNLGASDLFMYRATAHYNLREHKLAIADYTAALRLRPDFPDAYYGRGLAYQEINDSRRAVGDFSAAIRLRPDDTNAYFQRGYEYRHIGDYQRAIADFSKVVRLAPDHARAYYYRGTAYEELGDVKRAAPDFAAAERIDPKLGNAYY